MSSTQSHFQVRFWGVRGNIPCPGPDTVKYGGNTPCVEMSTGDTRLIFDAGTGLRVLGQALLSQMPVEGHLFFTHCHWDHIQGFPFFIPAFIKGNSFHLYGVPSQGGQTLEQRLHDQMLHPNFPVPLQVMGADLQFHNLAVGQELRIGDVRIDSASLNHPGDAVGYRVTWQGRSIAYVTDTEHFADRLDENVLYLARDADVLIYDAPYSDEEYERQGRQGWGHSTWQEAVKVAIAAGVERLVIFHHDPVHCDRELDAIGEEVKARFPNSCMAMEGMAIQLVPQEARGSASDAIVSV
jgi:phosphoribosyl 1,2-cyclic phosphodiesterase